MLKKRRRLSERRELRKQKLRYFPLIFATIVLISGTYAWFIFYSNVNSTMSGHVSSWKIDFTGGEDMTKEFTVDISDIYPGMEDFKTDLTITNSGDTDAVVTSVIKSIRIFDQTFSIGQKIDGVALNAAALEEYIRDNYPFKFNFESDTNTIKSGESTVLDIGLSWPYVTYVEASTLTDYDDNLDYYILDGDDYIKQYITEDDFDSMKDSLYYANDEEDTHYGELAYTWKKAEATAGTNRPCISVVLEVNATQDV